MFLHLRTLENVDIARLWTHSALSDRRKYLVFTRRSWKDDPRLTEIKAGDILALKEEHSNYYPFAVVVSIKNVFKRFAEHRVHQRIRVRFFHDILGAIEYSEQRREGVSK